MIWALSREDLSSGCLTKRVSNQSPQLLRLARKLKFHLKQVYFMITFQKANNKDADHTARIRRLPAPVLFANPQRQVFLRQVNYITALIGCFYHCR